MILLWLLCAGVTGQDFCSSPGDLPAAKLFLNTTSAQEGDPVLERCAYLPKYNVTKVIFCKDGMEFSSQKFKPEQISSTLLLTTSMKSAGRYSCGYQHKDEKNQVTSSNHSAPLQLMVTDRKAPPDGSSVTDRPENTPPHKGAGVTGQEFCSSPDRKAPPDGSSVSDRPENTAPHKGRKLIPSPSPSPEDPPSQTGAGITGQEFCSSPGPAMSVYIWILRYALVLLLLVSAPIITNILERTSHRSA